MIVTDSTLVGFTMINGSWGLQMGLLVACLFNFIIYPNIDIPQSVDISAA